MNPIIVIFAAPSGSGKSTIARAVAKDPRFVFSVSSTTRAPRGSEQDGIEYHFMTQETFRARITEDAFVEYEEVYPDKFYGTTKAEIERIFALGKNIVFDVDVKGALNLKKYFGDRAINFFIKVPSMDVLKERLAARGTESSEELAVRIAKAEEETAFESQFDYSIVNDHLNRAIDEIKGIIEEKMKQ